LGRLVIVQGFNEGLTLLLEEDVAICGLWSGLNLLFRRFGLDEGLGVISFVNFGFELEVVGLG